MDKDFVSGDAESTPTPASGENDVREVVILGAAGGGVEVLVYIQDMMDAGVNVKPIGFVDDNPNLENQNLQGLPVLGSTEWALEQLPPHVLVVSSIGNTSKKDSVMKRFGDAGFGFFSVVHPSAHVGREVTVGQGVVIAPGTVLTTNVKVGDHSIVNVGCTVSHDVVIGPCCTLNQGVRIAGGVTLGRGVYLGANATILHSIEIGDFAVVGASAMVNRSVPPRVTTVGIPAKIVHNRRGGGGPRGGGGRSYRGQGGGSRGGGQRRDSRGQGGGYRDRDSGRGGQSYNR